jgi:hypothetical protein
MRRQGCFALVLSEIDGLDLNEILQLVPDEDVAGDRNLVVGNPVLEQDVGRNSEDE